MKERIDELGIGGYKIIQDIDSFCFGVDAVLLADFADIRPYDKVCDLGCGNGIIPILISANTKASHITGIEIQKNQCELANKSLKLNSLCDKIDIICSDIRNIKDTLPKGSFDVVVSNPPYKKAGGGLENPVESHRIARHEIMCNLNDVISTAAYLLKPGGRLSVIHRPERICDLISGMRENKIEPKRMRLIYPKVDRAPSMVLIEGRKGGRNGFSCEPPLIIHELDSSYSKEIDKIYRRGDACGD